ncbi:MAG: hypothetical protein M3044_06475 [Thermoproteota archaeon]|nr:hypothetical protein [Thermoproteota archaeon]
MKTITKHSKPYGDESLAKIGGMVMRVYHKINGTPEIKMKGAKEIVFAMLKSSHKDLQKSSAVDQVVYRTVAEELLKHADSGTYPTSFPPTSSKMPGDSSIGNNPVPDKKIEPSAYSKQYCFDKLSAAGITDQSTIDEICASWNGAIPPEAGQNKCASVNPDPNYGKPSWLIARENLFSGGPGVTYPKKRFEEVDTKQSRSEAVIANSPEAPAWVQTLIPYRQNHPVEPNEQQIKENLKNASMNPKEPAWYTAYKHHIHRQ